MTTLPISDKQKQSSKWRFVNEQGRNVLPDAVVFQVSVTSGGKVVSEPIEKGSFMSYNKVLALWKSTLIYHFRGLMLIYNL